jgi:hypothetical protein
MIYKPKYCCHCGEKIERTKWTLASSRRFCQVCETDFAAQEWIRRIAFVLISAFGVVGLFGYFQAPEKPLKIASARPIEQIAETKKNPINGAAHEKTSADIAAVAAEPQNPANIAAQAPHQIAVSTKQAAPTKTAKNQSNSEEPTYFCGAATKKGTPCSHRVKGGGRCWQHAGQPAVLPPEKLIAIR